MESKSDWLRSEIEKLDNMLRDPSDYLDQRNVTQYNYPINTIITRYKEELLELDKTTPPPLVVIRKRYERNNTKNNRVM